MEATGSYWEALAVFLCDQGIDVSVVNPGLIKKEAESWNVRNKTDKLDATVIARFCLAKRPRLWSAPKVEVRELRDLVRHLDSLEEEKQRHQNRLGSGALSDVVVSSLCEVIEFLDSQIDDVEKRIRDHVNKNPGLKANSLLLESIPGIGEKTAATILAELQEVSNFNCAKQVAAYAGVSPKKTMSGKFAGKTRMCKIGNSRLRKALYFPAIVASTFNPVVKAFYKRLLRKGACKMSAIGACMRKLLIIAYGVLKTGTSFEVPA
jgi:transposase